MKNEVEVTEEEVKELKKSKSSAKRVAIQKAAKFEEASVASGSRANRRATRRHTAHVPGPRQKPKLDPRSAVAVEDRTGGEAPAEPKVRAETVKSKKGKELEAPIKLGSVDE